MPKGHLDNQTTTESEEAEKDKAHAIALSNYEEILSVSEDLDESLDKIKDWSKASRSEVMTGMKSLEKWSSKFAELNKAYREFVLATSKYQLPDEPEKVECAVAATTERYKEVTAAVNDQDTMRELYSLAGSNKEQVRLPKFGGSSSEDFATFKSKLLVAFFKSWNIQLRLAW